jgi:hypothetical protein
MHILYKVTYLPHLNTDYPKFYIGSKYNYKGNYYGSVDSKQVYEYTGGKPLRDWWKLQKESPENFLFEILETFDDITPEELVNKERDLQLTINVLSEEFFNHSIATKGFCSKKRSEETKRSVSQKTREYWESEAGKLKKQRLSERNKKFQSDWMKEKWKNPSESMVNKTYHGRPKGSKDVGERKPRSTIRKVCYDGIVYENAIEASEVYGVHPVTIRRWCKDNMNKWSYV